MAKAHIPVEKRLILFFVLATVIVVGHLFLQAKFAPKKPAAKDAAAQKLGDKKGGDKKGDQPENGKQPGDPARANSKASNASSGCRSWKSGSNPMSTGTTR